MQQRKNSWQDGVVGTTCPIPPGKNFTYVIQVKDQIGSFYYFPSLAFHKAAGAFGAIRVWSRPRIPVPFSPPDGDFWLLAGDWYKTNHYVSTLLIALISLLEPQEKELNKTIYVLVLGIWFIDIYNYIFGFKGFETSVRSRKESTES